jgi:hypothetical protein
MVLALLLGWLSVFSPGAVQAGSDSLTVTITPRDEFPPSPVADLSGSPGAEGQLLLQWTAPDSNNDVFALKTPASGYQLRIATFSADSVGSTTTWWNAASPVAGPPAPGAPPAMDSKLLNGLEPGATFYAAIKSTDSAGNESLIDAKTPVAGTQASALVYDAVPPAPAGLALAAVGSNSITISWGAVAAPDLWSYRVHVDSTPPYDFADEFVVGVASTAASYSHMGLSAATSYYYRVTALDKGAPTYNGWALESVPSNTVGALTGVVINAPMAPFGIGLVHSSTFTANVTWMPVRAFASGAAFVDPSNAQPAELDAYLVYRATAPVKAPWTNVATVSTNTFAWPDALSGPQFYYHVKARNTSGLSEASMARAQTGSGWIVGYDGLSSMEIPESLAAALSGSGGDPDTAYRVGTSSHPEQLDAKILKSMEIKAWKGGVLLDPSLELGGMGHLHLHYDLNASGGVAPSAGAPAAANPQSLSVFWFNGAKWVQMYGKVDELAQVMNVDTKYLGQYQLRSVERVTEFTFNPAGLSNKMISPNGDGKNDAVVFTFDNPRGSEVTGRVLNMKGTVVATMTQGPIGSSLMWDGSSGGRAVPGGIYIYQIQAEGKTFSGTVLIIK